MTLHRKISVLLAMGLMCAIFAHRAPAASPSEVDRAIKALVEKLYADQQNGNWEGPATGHTAGQVGGRTALATYALLAAGESHQDPRVRQAINYLLQVEMDGVYAIGMRAQVWNYIPSNDAVRNAARRDAVLLHGAARINKIPGMSRYKINSPDYDHSASQIAVLGMWAAAQAAVEVPDAYWKMVDEAWRKNQEPDGGWGYRLGAGDSRATMTAAGIATLFITQDYLSRGKDLNCTGNVVDANINKGLDWMIKQFQAPRFYTSMYGWYGIERIGVASGYKYFGTTNWFEVGAESIARRIIRGQLPGAPVDVSFAILFLARGRAPVMMNKLAWEIETHGDTPRIANWNNRPRDAANLARWVGKQMERELHWQIVNLKVDVDDLHDAPILYISGNQNLQLSDEHEKKLKAFVEGGGLILAHADCNNVTFAAAFRKLAQKLFPLYEFRNLPDDHVIYTRQQFPLSMWRRRLPVQSMSNGTREIMMLIPTGDPARNWQMQAVGGREETWYFMSNLFLYAVDKRDLRYKGQTYVIGRDAKVTPTANFSLGRVQYDGNWDPEPGGWRRIANLMHSRDRLDLKVSAVTLDGKFALKPFNALHLTGTGGFKLNEQQRTVLGDYLKEGGTLIVDAAGGNRDFVLAVENELAGILPEPFAAIAPTHAALASVTGPESPTLYRPFAQRLVADTRAVGLRVKSIEGREAVYLSGEDLSTGIVGMPIDGVFGYTPEAATQLVAGLINHIAKRPQMRGIPNQDKPVQAIDIGDTGEGDEPQGAAPQRPAPQKPAPQEPAPQKPATQEPPQKPAPATKPAPAR